MFPEWILLFPLCVNIAQATVAALSVLSEDPYEYSAHPILLSGTCKKETSVEHARLIQTVLTAAENQSWHDAAFYHTVCIASDGEAKCGNALVHLTMCRNLDENSPIYEHVRQLHFMNLLVGHDDVMADKDLKHVFKRQQNLIMCNKGIFIQRFCIAPSILRNHLQLNGVSSVRLRSLLNPNDWQDVILGYSLLKEIRSLPPLSKSEDTSPSFLQACKALYVYGQFACNLIMLYICVDLNLDEQLIQLSTAVHLALYLFSDNSVHTKFMPTQSYINIMIMVKNMYFCVAKIKVDNLSGKQFIIQLGTDRLETFFGLVQTAVGPNNNVDMIQLGSCASGLTEVAVILAHHPGWDRSPRCLQLPVISRDSGVITSKADHINPTSWRGNVDVSTINLQTYWILGCQKAVELVPEAGLALELLDSMSGVNILSPFGEILVGTHDADNEYDCTELASTHTNIEHDWEEKDALDTSTGERVAAPFTYEVNMEDAIADDILQNTRINSEVAIEGLKTTKAKALRHRMMYQTNWSSTDWLKRVQEIPCFNTIPSSEPVPTLYPMTAHLDSLVCISEIPLWAWCSVKTTFFSQSPKSTSYILLQTAIWITSNFITLPTAHQRSTFKFCISYQPLPMMIWLKNMIGVGLSRWTQQWQMSQATSFTRSTPRCQFTCLDSQHTFLKAHSCYCYLQACIRSCGHKICMRFPLWSAQNTSPIGVRGKHALFASRMSPMVTLVMRMLTACFVAPRCILTDQVGNVSWNIWAHTFFPTMPFTQQNAVGCVCAQLQCAGWLWKRAVERMQVLELTLIARCVRI